MKLRLVRLSIKAGCGLTYIIKFYKGLGPIVQNTVATLGQHAAKLEKPKEWFEAAQKVSQN